MKKFGAPSAGKYGQENGTASSIVIPVMTAVRGVKNAFSMRKSTTTVSVPISMYLRNLRSPAATATLAPPAEPTKTPNVTRPGGISIHAICSLRHSTRLMPGQCAFFTSVATSLPDLAAPSPRRHAHLFHHRRHQRDFHVVLGAEIGARRLLDGV